MGSIRHFERIVLKTTFDNVYKKPDKVWHTPYFVLFYKKSRKYEAAFVASKKIGKAVQRNRAKRLLRAHFIETLQTLPEGSYIFIAKAPLLNETFTKVHQAFIYALKRCTVQKRTHLNNKG